MNCRAQLVGNTYQIKSFIAKRQNDYQKIKELIVTAVEGILRDNSNPNSRESEHICVFIEVLAIQRRGQWCVRQSARSLL